MIKWICEGKLWFDQRNGNTYHSVRITSAKNKEIIAEQGITYGYGDAWQFTCKDILIKKGLLKEEDKHNHDKIRGWFYWISSEVLKRDLFKGAQE